TGNDVVIAVAINVVGVHLGAAGRRELYRVKLPARAAFERLRLLKPAVLREHVQSAVTVDVTHAQPMTKRIGRVLFRDGCELPRFQRLGRVPGGVTKETMVAANQLRLLVPHDIDEL